MKDNPINLVEIARLANVHPSTASRALNGNPLVKEETRRLIQEIAQKHGYIPDAVAQSLNQGRTSTLGIVVPEISNSFYSHIVDTIDQSMMQHGYNLIICNSRFDPETELRAIRTLMGKRVDALVVCVPSPQAEALLLSLSQRIPVIACDVVSDDIGLDCVYTYERKGLGGADAKAPYSAAFASAPPSCKSVPFHDKGVYVLVVRLYAKCNRKVICFVKSDGSDPLFC